MRETMKIAAGAAASLAMIASGVAGSAVAQTVQAGPAETVASAEAAASGQVLAPQSQRAVEGVFSYSQGDVDSMETIEANLYGASRTLCGSEVEVGAPAGCSDAMEWCIAVTGDVENSFVATVGELTEAGPFCQVMGCSCAGNPADGRASISAEAGGFTVASVLEAACPLEGVNTITFVSEDGFSVSLPLSYVAQRASVIAWSLNGESMAECLGVSNQLWLGSTSARYFAQNIVEIRLTAEVTPPPAPGTEAAGDMYDNLPNIAVMASLS